MVFYLLVCAKLITLFVVLFCLYFTQNKKLSQEKSFIYDFFQLNYQHANFVFSRQKKDARICPYRPFKVIKHKNPASRILNGLTGDFLKISVTSGQFPMATDVVMQCNISCKTRYMHNRPLVENLQK
jgi:hypothetical protein